MTLKGCVMTLKGCVMTLKGCAMTLKGCTRMADPTYWYHPVGQVSKPGDLHGSQYGNINMAATRRHIPASPMYVLKVEQHVTLNALPSNHGKRLVTGEEGSSW